MTNKRFELLHKIIADERSTELERAAALRELDADSEVSQNAQDAELERFWRDVESRSNPDRSQLSAGTQDILDDLSRYFLVIPPKEGVVDRLTQLLDQTNSEKVRQKVVPVLSAITYLIDSGRITFATNS